MTTERESASGFTLIELMVALMIGLIIMAAVSVIFVNSKKAYQVQDKLARIQENGRFAMDFIVRDVRMAGYFGCQGVLKPETLLPPNSAPSTKFRSSLKNTIVPVSGGGTLAAIPFPYRLDIALEGFDGDASPSMTAWAPSGANGASNLPATRLAGTDMIAVRMADSTTQVLLAAKMTSDFDDLKVTSVGTFQANDIAMISDCDSVSITQITDVDSTSSPKKLIHSTTSGFTPGNDTKKLAKVYGDESSGGPPPDIRAVKIFKYATNRYYIRNNANNVPSLYRDTNGGAAVELVEGIEDMQILYGVDLDDSDDAAGMLLPNRYYRADQVPNWARVVAVRIGILARTPSNPDLDVDRNTYDVNGKSVTVCPALPATCADKNQRRVFMTTVQLRNFKPREP